MSVSESQIRKVMAELGKRGGNVNSKAQQEARKSNAKKAREGKRQHSLKNARAVEKPA